jgi:cytochrome oxidase Cu insertion factor (SCO1/SenC/PrrC family)
MPAPTACAGLTGCLVAALIAGACTPIPARDTSGAQDPDRARGKAAEMFGYDPGVRPLRIGEAVPDHVLLDAGGAPFALSSLRGHVIVLTFFAAGADDADTEILARIARVQERLAPPAAGAIHLVSVLLDTSSSAADILRSHAAMASRTGVPWTFARADPAVTGALAGAFDVALWQAPDGRVRHTFNTVVIDRRGTLVDRFPGLDGWSANDLLAAAVAAAR